MVKYGFYHIYTANHWRKVVDEQLTLIQESGILNEVDKIYWTSIGGEDCSINLDKFERFDLPYRYEYPTLVKLQEVCLEQDCWVFYMHTKGVSRSLGEWTSVDSWRQYMGYFLLKRYKDCWRYLEIYDAVGVDLGEGPFLHFSGNFFWTKSDYVRTLPRLKDSPHFTEDRIYAEKWLGSKGGNFKGLMHCARLLYQVPIYPEEYINKEI